VVCDAPTANFQQTSLLASNWHDGSLHELSYCTCTAVLCTGCATVMGRALGRRRSESSVSHLVAAVRRRALHTSLSLTTFVSSAGQGSSAAAKETPCRPGLSALGASAEL